MIALGQAHYPSEKYFPLPLIVKLLEQYSCEKRWNVKFVYQTLKEIGISCVDLLPLYDQLFKARVRQTCFVQEMNVMYYLVVYSNRSPYMSGLLMIIIQ